MLKKIIVLAVAGYVLSLSVVVAQAPSQSPAENTQQQAIHHEAASYQLEYDLMEEKLKGLSEFQTYLKDQQKLQQLQQQYEQAATRRTTAPQAPVAQAPVPPPTKK